MTLDGFAIFYLLATDVLAAAGGMTPVVNAVFHRSTSCAGVRLPGHFPEGARPTVEPRDPWPPSWRASVTALI